MFPLITAFVLSLCPGAAHGGDAAATSADVWERLLDRVPARTSTSTWLIEGDGVSRGALVSLRSITGLRRTVLEREIVFADSGVRIVETEELAGRRRTAVYREFRPTGSRTWIVKWTLGDRASAARTVGYGWDRPVHGALAAEAEGQDPVIDAGRLELFFRGGRGRLAGDLTTVDPASATAVRVRVERGAEPCRAVRANGGLLHEVVRADEGSGPAIAAFRLHGAGRVARPIEREHHLRLLRKWSIESRPAHEAMLALIPRRGSIVRR